MTALLRLKGGLEGTGQREGHRRPGILLAYDQSEVTINGRRVPLESDSTAPLAYRLNRSRGLEYRLKRFITAAD